MSRKRNRHRSLSTVSRDSERSKSQSQKKDLIGRSTTNSIFLPNENRDGVSYELRNQEKLFNRYHYLYAGTSPSLGTTLIRMTPLNFPSCPHLEKNSSSIHKRTSIIRKV